MFKRIFTHRFHAFVWLFNLFGGSFGSYLLVHIFQLLQKMKFLKYHRAGQGHFKDTPVLFIFGFNFLRTVGTRKKRKKKMEKWEQFQQHEKYKYDKPRLFILWQQSQKYINRVREFFLKQRKLFKMVWRMFYQGVFTIFTLL